MSQLQRVGMHKTIINANEKYTTIQYWNTEVVKFNEREIILDTGGYFTATTKVRMNQASNEFNLGYKVYQKAHRWYVQYRWLTLEFKDNILTLDRIMKKEEPEIKSSDLTDKIIYSV